MEFINSIDEESLRHKLCIFTGLQVVAFIGAMIFFGDFYADSGLFIPFFIYLLITFVECISGGFFRIIEAFKFAVGSVTAILTLSLIPDVKKGYYDISDFVYLFLVIISAVPAIVYFSQMLKSDKQDNIVPDEKELALTQKLCLLPALQTLFPALFFMFPSKSYITEMHFQENSFFAMQVYCSISLWLLLSFVMLLEWRSPIIFKTVEQCKLLSALLLSPFWMSGAALFAYRNSTEVTIVVIALWVTFILNFLIYKIGMRRIKRMKKEAEKEFQAE